MVNNNFESVFIKSYEKSNHDIIYRKWFSDKYVANVKGWRRIFHHRLTFKEITKNVESIEKALVKEIPNKNKWKERNNRLDKLQKAFKIVYEHKFSKLPDKISYAQTVLNSFPDQQKLSLFLNNLKNYLDYNNGSPESIIASIQIAADKAFYVQTIGEYLRDDVSYDNGVGLDETIDKEKVKRAQALVFQLNKDLDDNDKLIFKNSFADFTIRIPIGKNSFFRFDINSTLLKAQCDFPIVDFNQLELTSKNFDETTLKSFVQFIHTGHFVPPRDWYGVEEMLEDTSPFYYFNIKDPSAIDQYMNFVIKHLFRPNQNPYAVEVTAEERIQTAAEAITTLCQYAEILEKRNKFEQSSHLYMFFAAILGSFAGSETSFIDKGKFTQELTRNFRSLSQEQLFKMSTKMREFMQEFKNARLIFDFNIYQGKLVAHIPLFHENDLQKQIELINKYQFEELYISGFFDVNHRQKIEALLVQCPSLKRIVYLGANFSDVYGLRSQEKIHVIPKFMCKLSNERINEIAGTTHQDGNLLNPEQDILLSLNKQEEVYSPAHCISIYRKHPLEENSNLEAFFSGIC